MGSNNFWRSNLNLGVYFFLDCGTFNDYLDTLLDFCDRLLNYFYMDILFTKKSQAGALLMIFRLFMEGKFDAYVLYWSKGKPFYIFWIICPAFVSLTFLIKQNKIFVFFCRVHSIFCFSLFGNRDQKKNVVLFVYFLYKNPQFAWKRQQIFLVSGYFDQTTKNKRWNEPDKRRQNMNSSFMI